MISPHWAERQEGEGVWRQRARIVGILGMGVGSLALPILGGVYTWEYWCPFLLWFLVTYSSFFFRNKDHILSERPEHDQERKDID